MESQRRIPLLKLVAIACATGLLASPARGVPPQPGAPAPALRARTFAGETIDLAAWRGHVVLVHYWASWCVPCREEMPRLDALYRQWHAQGLEILALSADDRHDRGAAARAAAAFAYPAGMVAQADRDDFGPPSALPTTYVIGRDGVVAAVLRANRGSVSDEQLQSVVLPLLEQDPGTGK